MVDETFSWRRSLWGGIAGAGAGLVLGASAAGFVAHAIDTGRQAGLRGSFSTAVVAGIAGFLAPTLIGAFLLPLERTRTPIYD